MRYSLQWGNTTNISNVFVTDNSGQPLQPIPLVNLFQEDGLPIAYRKEVHVIFEPAPQDVTSPTGTSVWSSPSESSALFESLVFYGVRGQRYVMHFFVDADDAAGRVSASVEVAPCLPTEYVSAYMDCAACPPGAICNGTGVLVAQVNYWRTGWFSRDGAYHSNTNEYYFLRCPTAACGGGVGSGCRTGTGPYCGTCAGGEAWSAFVLRCSPCTAGVGHLFGWLGCLLLQMLVLLTVVPRSLHALGKEGGALGALWRILIDWIQQLGLFLQASRVPDVREELGLVGVALSWVEFQTQGERQLSCFTHWSVYLRMVYYAMLPAVNAGLFLLLGALFLKGQAVWRGRREKQKVRFRDVCRFGAPEDAHTPDSARLAYGLLDSRGHRPCDVCCDSFATWYCEDEALYMCGGCETRLHPRTNPQRLQHLCVPVRSDVGGGPAPLGAFCLVLWETYRFTMVPTIVGLMQWLHLGAHYCNGRPPGAGTCGRYLASDSSVAGWSEGYWAMFAGVLAAIGVWGLLVPGLPLGLLWTHRGRLHQDRIRRSWGWLYETYTWSCCYEEVHPPPPSQTAARRRQLCRICLCRVALRGSWRQGNISFGGCC